MINGDVTRPIRWGPLARREETRFRARLFSALRAFRRETRSRFDKFDGEHIRREESESRSCITEYHLYLCNAERQYMIDKSLINLNAR